MLVKYPHLKQRSLWILLNLCRWQFKYDTTISPSGSLIKNHVNYQLIEKFDRFQIAQKAADTKFKRGFSIPLKGEKISQEECYT